MTSSLTIMPSTSTSYPSPLTFRRCTTVTRPDLQQGLVIEYTLINPPETPPPNEKHPSACDTRLPPLEPNNTTTNNNNNNNNTTPRRPQRQWLGLPPPANTPTTATEKKRRLERMNLRGDNRLISRTSNSQRTNSSCKRSDSATNDSQKSALTVNSLEDRLSEDKMKHIAQLEMEEHEEITEEKLEQRKNFEKCMNWIQALPSKFSGMHIAQERAPVTKD